MISKVPGLPDAPVTRSGPYQPFGQLVFNGPKVHDYLHEINTEVYSEYDPVINVGECPAVTPEMGLKYVAKAREELKMIFQFEHTDIDLGPAGKFSPKSWKLTDFKKIMNKWQYAMQSGDGWNSLYLENHDQPRSVSRYGDDSKQFRDVSTRGLAMFHIGLAGTPYIYQGQELGMTNRSEWPIEDCRDLETINHYREVIKARAREQGKDESEIDMSDVLVEFQKKSRDNARTPVHWSSEKYAGFSNVEPWIPMMHDYKEYNAADQVGTAGSHYEWFKQLLRLRKNTPALLYGNFDVVDQESEEVYAFTRTYESKIVLVVCNFTSRAVSWKAPQGQETRTLVLSSYADARDHDGPELHLGPRESRIYTL